MSHATHTIRYPPLLFNKSLNPLHSLPISAANVYGVRSMSYYWFLFYSFQFMFMFYLLSFYGYDYGFCYGWLVMFVCLYYILTSKPFYVISWIILYAFID